MTASELIASAHRRGSRLVVRRNHLEVHGRRLPDKLGDAIRERRAELIAALEAMEIAAAVEAAADSAPATPPPGWTSPAPQGAPNADFGECFDCGAALGVTPEGDRIEIGLCPTCRDRRILQMAKARAPARVEVRPIEKRPAVQMELIKVEAPAGQNPKQKARRRRQA